MLVNKEFEIGVPMQIEIGEKLKQLRLRANLTQEELARRCELSKGFISQVERGLTSPSIATLVDYLECLGSNLQEFFQDPVKQQVVYKQEDAYTAENEELGHIINWIVPDAHKNTMEPITVRLRPKGQTEEYNPHAGEVFGYVQTGAITLHIGKNHWRIKKGDYFYYTASDSYCIKNHTVNEAVVLWVTSPPSF